VVLQLWVLRLWVFVWWPLNRAVVWASAILLQFEGVYKYIY